MNANKKLLVDSVGAGLKEAGYKKNGSAWSRRNAESVTVVDIQTSRFAQVYFLNLGIKYAALGDLKTIPKTYQCNVGCRVNAIVSDRASAIRLFDFEGDARELDATARFEEIDALIRGTVVPFLDECATVDGVKRVIPRGRLEEAMVHIDLR
jgi:hypothetical protein